jgi:hypothetical protein
MVWIDIDGGERTIQTSVTVTLHSHGVIVSVCLAKIREDQGCVMRPLGRSIRKYTCYTKNTYSTIVGKGIISYLGVPTFDPKWNRFAPKSPKTFPMIFQYIICY